MPPDDERLPDWKRPEMHFERKATLGGGAASWTGAGLEFAVWVALFFLAGRWLDGTVGSEPWGAALGGLLGAVIGTVRLVRRALRTTQRPEDRPEGKAPDR